MTTKNMTTMANTYTAKTRSNFEKFKNDLISLGNL
jgi:hypothetical protein